MKQEPGKLQILIYRAAIISSLIAVLNIIFRWYENQYPTLDEEVPMYIYKIHDAIKISDFLSNVILVIIMIIVIVSFMGVGVYEVSVKTNFKIVGALILTIVIYFIFRSANIMVMIDKQICERDREKVASMVVNGEIGKGGIREEIELPKEYKRTSKDHGEITIRREEGNVWVYFATYRGMLKTERNVFVYCKEDSEKLLPDSYGHTYEEKKLREHWCWAVIK
jgi:hypothetical protein